MPAEAGANDRKEAGPYAWYLLGVLVLVYVLNYVDRQLLTILAPDLKRDLGISDADFGFLYGTAFGVFYALFGIPLGKLADRWSRVRLLALGLGLWSAMTALSGLSRNFGQIAVARMGVGIGEATAAPCAYSLIGDYFPPHRRATALGIYSIGLFLGGGVSLFLGSAIARAWNEGFGPGGAPLGLVGWQAAFLILGLPGLLLAAWVGTLREPARGGFDAPDASGRPAANARTPWAGLLCDLGDIVPPFTLIAAARRGARALAANVLAALVLAALATALTWATGDAAQWAALGVGFYAVLSWASATRRRDPSAFAALCSPAFVGVTLGYGLFAVVGYANVAFTPLYAIQELGVEPTRAGLVIGGIGGLAGAGGVVIGGILADRLARGREQHRRIALALLAATAGMIGHAVMFSTASLPLFYAMVVVVQLGNSVSLVGASGTIVNIVSPHLRGTAAAAFGLAGNLLGLALGPYAAGKMSTLLGDLGQGATVVLVVAPFVILSLAVACRALAGPSLRA